MPPKSPKGKPESQDPPQDPSEPQEPAPPPSPARRAKIEALKAELLGDLLTTAEVAEILDVHPRTVGEYLRDGKLEGIQLAGGWRVSEKSLRKFVELLSEAPTAGGGMFGRFTHRARRTVILAQDEARRLNHSYIGTEHLLLVMLAEGEGVAAKALTEMGISLNLTRIAVEDAIGRGENPRTKGYIPFTPRGKKVLELSLREALHLGHKYIGTEHLLLGLVREGEGVAAQILARAGAELDDVRVVVLELLSGRGRPEAADQVPAPHTTLSPQARAKALAVLGSLGPKAKRQTSKLAVKPKPSKPAAKAPRKRPAAKRPPRKTG